MTSQVNKIPLFNENHFSDSIWNHATQQQREDLKQREERTAAADALCSLFYRSPLRAEENLSPITTIFNANNGKAVKVTVVEKDGWLHPKTPFQREAYKVSMMSRELLRQIIQNCGPNVCYRGEINGCYVEVDIKDGQLFGSEIITRSQDGSEKTVIGWVRGEPVFIQQHIHRGSNNQCKTTFEDGKTSIPVAETCHSI